jgi:hypothetical protein
MEAQHALFIGPDAREIANFTGFALIDDRDTTPPAKELQARHLLE